jgi:predicted nucleic acid-binding protein
MTILDSSCWIEIFLKGPLYNNFVKFLSDPKDLIVPTLTLTEVFKKLLIDRSERVALYIIGQMEQCKIVDLTQDLALEAAKFGKYYRLPLADSIIYATTLHHDAKLYTLDKHFEGLSNVEYFQK